MSFAVSAGAVSTNSFAEGISKSNKFWWPEHVDLSPLRQHSPESNPMGDGFDYAKEFVEGLGLKYNDAMVKAFVDPTLYRRSK